MSLLNVFAPYNVRTQKNGQLRCMCPFRDKHTGVGTGQGLESMYLSPDINSFHCFSCGAKGKLTTLLMSDMFEIPFFEAVEYVRLTEYRKEVKDTIHSTQSEYMIDFSKPPKEFLERGFSKELLKYFRVGMTDKPNVAAIPLYDFERNLQGIKYRNLKEREFWYNEGFEKDHYLYNFNPNAPYTILVEGETDTWRAHSWGYFVSSSLSKNLSPEQAEIIANSKVDKVYLSLNSDMPGVIGTHKAYKLLSKYKDVEILNLPAKDVDECKPRTFKHSFENPVNYAEFRLLTNT